MNVKRILCPIDLSANSLAAVDVATSMASQYGAPIRFLYVAPSWSDPSLMESEYVESFMEEQKNKLENVKPTNESVSFDHEMLQGSPGPEIVRAAEPGDMVVMSTHGLTGILRLVMGSVAQYVLRNAECLVIMVKSPKITRRPPEDDAPVKKTVSEAMHQVGAVQGEDPMANVVRQLERARESATPVVDSMSRCIGILTMTDIERYRELQARYDAGDKSVVKEMFETDPYGQRRPTNYDFHQVRRHMTAPVITISNSQSLSEAQGLFDANPNIHHLVVVDDQNRPVGILETRDIKQTNQATSDA